MKMQAARYASFLVRLWTVAQAETAGRAWQGEIEHIQQGQTWPVYSLEDLPALLRQLAEMDDFQSTSDKE